MSQVQSWAQVTLAQPDPWAHEDRRAQEPPVQGQLAGELLVQELQPAEEQLGRQCEQHLLAQEPLQVVLAQAPQVQNATWELLLDAETARGSQGSLAGGGCRSKSALRGEAPALL